MQEVLGALTVLLMSVLKFFFTPLISYGMGYGFLRTLLLMAIGGCAGMMGFYWAGTHVLEWFRKRRLRRDGARAAKGLAPKRIFTRTNRWIVRVKSKYGIPGLALMPPILSIPITAVIAAKYFHHDRRTLPVLLGAVVIWSVVLCSTWGFVQ